MTDSKKFETPNRCKAINKSGKNIGKRCSKNARPNMEFCGIPKKQEDILMIS